jgi:rhodanese-related sulfurtransferase/uncharacterized membrane protein YedE/YeeE
MIRGQSAEGRAQKSTFPIMLTGLSLCPLPSALCPLLIAIAIGIAFGFTLERAGLGNARKLAGQFYFTDFTVFKVMFSAIVVAMLGAFWLSRLGVLDLRGVYVPETWLMPQLIGGLLFGAGFVVAGLCPGTSCVSAATGRGDGLAAVGGMFIGVLLTGLAFTPLQRFYESTSRGSLTLPDLLHVPYGVVVFAIVVMALFAFVGLRRLAATGEPSPGMHRALGSAAIVLGALAAFAGSPYRESLPDKQLNVQQLASEVTREEDHVTAIELATWIKDRKPGLRVLDLRPETEFDEYHIPRAENVTFDALLRPRYASTDTLVLISDGGAHAAQGWVFLRALGHQHVYFLRGGLGEWLDDVMNPAKPTALTRYFGGVPRSGEDAQPNTVTNMRRRGC